MFEELANAMACLMWAFIILAPLGLWKLVEIVIWVVVHVRLSVG